MANAVSKYMILILGGDDWLEIAGQDKEHWECGWGPTILNRDGQGRSFWKVSFEHVG